MPSVKFPSRQDVALALLELEEAEKQRTRKALEYVNAQRRQPMKVPLDKLKLLRWGIFCFIVAAVILIGLVHL